jgi:uncharacterized membrane-anchored protein YhcB (DUF1043 family)
MEVTSIIASVVSVILGIFAIWLSITFYKMSDRISNEIKIASKDISSTVSRLEKLFESLYSDTFSIMKETYSDMRKHVWPEISPSSKEIMPTLRREKSLINVDFKMASSIIYELLKYKKNMNANIVANALLGSFENDLVKVVFFLRDLKNNNIISSSGPDLLPSDDIRMNENVTLNSTGDLVVIDDNNKARDNPK